MVVNAEMNNSQSVENNSVDDQPQMGPICHILSLLVSVDMEEDRASRRIARTTGQEGTGKSTVI